MRHLIRPRVPSTTARRFLRAPIDERERGVALIVIIGIGALVTALVTTAVVITASGMRYARDDVAWQGALAAAYAGVEEYQSRLTVNPGYVDSGNRAARFSAGSALRADPSNPAFDVTGSRWATVPGSNGTASFRYEVDNRTYHADGLLRLRATGRVGEETRTIVADVRRPKFLDYLFFTDYEIEDPAVTGKDCERWEHAGRSLSECGMISFLDGDEIDGWVHTNDTIRTCNAKFFGPVTTQYNPASGPRYKRGDSCSSSRAPVFHQSDPQRPNSPLLSGKIGMPETNTLIRVDAIASGCLYTGPTSITLNPGGTMTVRSPFTKVTRPGASNPRPDAICGRAGTGSGQLGSTGGATVPVPSGGAVYVQTVPGRSSDPNHTSESMTRSACGGQDSRNALGYPWARETVPKPIEGVQAYGCRNGDIFVRGTLQGLVTLAAENQIYVVGDTTYADRNRDMLGLIGNHMVWIHNPAINNWPDSPDRKLDAAILSLRSFAVQNAKTVRGDLDGTLTVRGSIAQKFRGVVHWNSGYTKDYRYDSRLRDRTPPYFLSPVSSPHVAATWIETSPVFKADGSYR